MVKAPEHATPTISRILPDGTLIEALYDAVEGRTALAVCNPAGAVSIESHLDLPTSERLVPYAAGNNLLASGCVLLPSDVGEFTDKDGLLKEVRAFIHRYVDLSPLYEEIAAHYVLLSWVHDAFNELPYLRFQGEYGTGKTRALLAIGSISYKAFFASGASTVSPIFHVLDAFGATLMLDEADLRFSDATADLTKILNNGNMKGLPVLRTMTNRHRELNPKAFKVFGPKIIAMRERFADEALESRFLTEATGTRALRPDIAISLPDAMHVEALLLRNRLLAWRFAARREVTIDPSRAIDALSPRGNQTALPLLSLMDDERLCERVAGDLVAGEARVATKRAAAPEATMVLVLTELSRSLPTPYLPLSAVASAYNREAEGRGGRPLSIKGVGWLLRGKLGLETTKTRGVYVIPQSERPKIEALAARHKPHSAEPRILPEVEASGFLARSAKKYARDA